MKITAEATLNFRREIIRQNQLINSFNNDDIAHLREFLLQHDLQTLLVPNEKQTLQEHIVSLVGKIGENIKLKRALAIATSSGNFIGTAAHGNTSAVVENCLMGTYVSAVVLKPLSSKVNAVDIGKLSKGLSQHVIGMNPQALKPNNEISGDDALLTQHYLLNDKITVSDLVAEANVEIVDFVRYGRNES